MMPRLRFGWGRQHPTRIAALISLTVLAVSLPAILLVDGISHDEVEHLLVAYRMLLGEVPFRDFPQNHLPAYWQWLALWMGGHEGTLLPLYLARGANIAAAAASVAFGWGLAGKIGRESLLSRVLFSALCVSLWHSLELYRVRPDSFMTFFATAAGCLLAARPRPAPFASFASGIFLGLAAVLSFKMIGLLLLLPGALVFLCPKTPWRARLELLSLHAAGIAIGVLPLMATLGVHGLWSDFFTNVIEANRFLKRPDGMLYLLFAHPSFAWTLLAVVLMLRRFPNAPASERAFLYYVPAWTMISYATLPISNHPDLYNIALGMVPQALCLTYVLNAALERASSRPWRPAVVLFGIFLIAQPLISPIFRQRGYAGVSPEDMTQLIAEHGQGRGTCIGLAPIHPIYCRSLSALSLGWDLFFLNGFKHTPYDGRFQKVWEDGLESALTGRADFIAKGIGAQNSWRRARVLGAFPEERFAAFMRRMEEDYRPVAYGPHRGWARKRRDPASAQ